MATLPPFPESYSVEIVRSDGARSVVYVDGETRRVEKYPKKGNPMILVSRADEGVIWSLSADGKTCTRVPKPAGGKGVVDPDALLDWTEDGEESIEGRRCRRFVGRSLETSRSSGGAHEVCYVDAETGIPRRKVTFDAKGEVGVTIDYVNVRMGPPPRVVFELPEGCRIR